jgi:hypothetical protein
MDEPATMEVAQARALLRTSVGEEEPVGLPRSVLSQLTRDDLPEGCAVQIGTMKDRCLHLDWSGTLCRKGTSIIGEADYTYTRKYWYSPLGLEQYLDLVRRAVETRRRTHGDVEVTHQDDDGAYVHLGFSILTTDHNLKQAFDTVLRVTSEVEETAQEAADEVGRRVSEVAARLSGWGSESLDTLVDKVGVASSTDEKGRSLEELCSRLFETVPGFTVTQRILTATEEIDIAVRNGSLEVPFNREEALILAECKNWSGKCGKDELVLFRQKIENRSQRCSLGFLISWNGFAGTVTKEMLRGSRERALVVPITGKQIRTAARSGGFARVLADCWDKAVNL